MDGLSQSMDLFNPKLSSDRFEDKLIFCLCCLPIVVMFGLVNAPGIEVLYLDLSMIMHQITKTASVYSDAI